MQANFDRDGFVVLRDPLGPHLRKVVAIGRSAARGGGNGFFSDVEWQVAAERRHLRRELGAVLNATTAATVMAEHQIVAAGFVTKFPGPAGVVPPHAHFTLVDERTAPSVIAWSPLHPVSEHEDNGPMRVLAGSHRVVDELWGSGSVPWYVDKLQDLAGAMKAVTVEPGDLLVMDTRLVHGSDVNRSSRPRVGVRFDLAPASLPMVHAVEVEADFVHLHPMSIDDWDRLPPGTIPSHYRWHYRMLAGDHDIEDTLPIVPDGRERIATSRRHRRPPDWTLLDALTADAPSDTPGAVAYQRSMGFEAEG